MDPAPMSVNSSGAPPPMQLIPPEAAETIAPPGVVVALNPTRTASSSDLLTCRPLQSKPRAYVLKVDLSILGCACCVARRSRKEHMLCVALAMGLDDHRAVQPL